MFGDCEKCTERRPGREVTLLGFIGYLCTTCCDEGSQVIRALPEYAQLSKVKRALRCMSLEASVAARSDSLAPLFFKSMDDALRAEEAALDTIYDKVRAWYFAKVPSA